MQLSVIIANYNVKYFLEQCLHSVEAACKNIDAEIIIVDNASDDGSAEYLRPKFPELKFIQNEINTGFAKANNRALFVAQGTYVLFLNPDTILAENTLTDCLRFFTGHPNAGAVGVQMTDGSGSFLPESKRAFPSIAASFWKLSGIAKLFPHSAIFNRYALGNISEDAIAEADVLSGAFFMARKDVLLELKGFDEDYFMYGEDIDLSYRIKKSGYKNYYLGNTSVVHFKGESAQKEKTEYHRNFYKAMKLFASKHYSRPLSYLLNTSISVVGFMGSLKNNFSLKKDEKESLNILVSGDDADTRSAEKILTTLHLNFQKIGSLDQLGSASNFKTQNIIFCTGQLSYAETISFIKTNKKRFCFFWHNGGSESIVGSNSRHVTGKIYSAV